jgi:Co/Zn/Cd efflux system component
MKALQFSDFVADRDSRALLGYVVICAGCMVLEIGYGVYSNSLGMTQALGSLI